MRASKNMLRCWSEQLGGVSGSRTRSRAHCLCERQCVRICVSRYIMQRGNHAHVQHVCAFTGACQSRCLALEAGRTHWPSLETHLGITRRPVCQYLPVGGMLTWSSPHGKQWGTDVHENFSKSFSTTTRPLRESRASPRSARLWVWRLPPQS